MSEFIEIISGDGMIIEYEPIEPIDILLPIWAEIKQLKERIEKLEDRNHRRDAD